MMPNQRARSSAAEACQPLAAAFRFEYPPKTSIPGRYRANAQDENARTKQSSALRMRVGCGKTHAKRRAGILHSPSARHHAMKFEAEAGPRVRSEPAA